MKLCRSCSLICVNYIQKCRFLMFCSFFQAFAAKQNFWTTQLTLHRKSLNCRFLLHWNFNSLFAILFIVISCIPKYMFSISWQLSQTMLWFLNDRRTHAVSYFILGVSPYLQSRSINRLLPLVLIYIYTGIILYYFFFTRWGLCVQRKKC